MSSSIQHNWPSAISSSLAPQARVRSCCSQNLAERLGLHRLVNEEIEARDDAPAFGAWLRTASQAHEKRTRQGAVLLGRGENLETVLAWHLKIQEDQCRPEELGKPQPHLAAESDSCRETRYLQEVGKSIRRVDIVVDHEHAKLIALI
jgi:hypothetical protein